MALVCSNCQRTLRGFVETPHGPRCVFCRGMLQTEQSHVVGALDPTVLDGYDNVTAVYQNTSLVSLPGDVRTEKDALVPYVQQTIAAVRQGGADVPPSLRAWWATWLAGWNTFYPQKSTIFSASGDSDRVKQMRKELADFQVKLLASCPDVGPLGVPSDSSLLGTISQAEKDLVKRADDAAKTFNTTVRIVTVVGGVLVAFFLYQQVKVAKTLGPSVVKALPFLGAL